MKDLIAAILSILGISLSQSDIMILGISVGILGVIIFLTGIIWWANYDFGRLSNPSTQ